MNGNVLMCYMASVEIEIYDAVNILGRQPIFEDRIE